MNHPRTDRISNIRVRHTRIMPKRATGNLLGNKEYRSDQHMNGQKSRNNRNCLV